MGSTHVHAAVFRPHSRRRRARLGGDRCRNAPAAARRRCAVAGRQRRQGRPRPHVRAHGCGQRSRRRPEPVRRARPGARRTQRGGHPRLLLSRDAARARASGKLRVLLAAAAKSLQISSTAPYAVKDAGGQTLSAGVRADNARTGSGVSVNGVPTTLQGPLTFAAAAGGLVSVGAALVSRDGRGHLDGRRAPGRRRRRASRPTSRGSSRVRCRARGRRPRSRRRPWRRGRMPLPRWSRGRPWDLYPDGRSQQYARRRGGDAGDDGGGQGDERRRAGLRRRRRDDVLLVVLWRSDAERSRRVRPRRPLPARSGRPLGRGVSVPHWQPRSYTGAQLAKALGLSAPVVDVQTHFSPSGRVVALSVTAEDGSSLAVAGTEARNRLAHSFDGLPSGHAPVPDAGGSASAGVALRLTGIARDADSPVLERLAADGSWTPVVRHLQVNATGTFAAVVHPTQTTTYRLSTSGLAGPVLTIPVVGDPTLMRRRSPRRSRSCSHWQDPRRRSRRPIRWQPSSGTWRPTTPTTPGRSCRPWRR